MDLSILIVNWNTREYLRNCLASIRFNPPTGKYEVIVVDNASSDQSADMVSDEFPEVRLIRNEENLVWAKGNNQAMDAASGRFLLLLNPDTEIKPGALDALVSFAAAHEDAAAVACRLIGTDGVVQRSCRGFPEPWGVFCEYIGLSRLFPGSKRFGSYRMTYFDYRHEAEVDQPMASCLLLSAEAVKDIGKFDEDFPIFFNEVDWCYRARQKGWKVFFTPAAEVVHHGGASTRQMKAQMVRESHRALKRFYRKYYRRRMNGLAYRLIMLAISINSWAASAIAARRTGEAPIV